MDRQPMDRQPMDRQPMDRQPMDRQPMIHFHIYRRNIGFGGTLNKHKLVVLKNWGLFIFNPSHKQ